MAAARILTEQEWDELEAAEQRYYEGEGTHAYTEVMPREESEAAAAMWDVAALGVEGLYYNHDEQTIRQETAVRVAHAIAVLAFGVEFARDGYAS